MRSDYYKFNYDEIHRRQLLVPDPEHLAEIARRKALLFHAGWFENPTHKEFKTNPLVFKTGMYFIKKLFVNKTNW